MPGYFGGTKASKIYLGDVKIGSAYMGGDLVYQSAFAVTYHVDSDVVYSEAIVPGTSALNPTTFTPTKSGWTFAGWRRDTTASSEVETNLTASAPINLYAVFKRTVECAFTSYNSTKTESGNAFYNNGNVIGTNFTLPTGAAYSGWGWRGWAASGVTNANASVAYANGAVIYDITESLTFYGLYEQTVTCTFASYSNNQTASGNRYYNAAGNSTTASVTVPTGAAYSGWTWRGWSAAGDTAGDASVAYANGATITGLTEGYTYYGMYQRTLTLSYNGNGADGGATASQTGVQYWSASGEYANPTISLNSCGFSLTYYSFVNWAMGSTGGTRYSAGASVTISASTTFYAIWDQRYATATANVRNIDLWEGGWNVVGWSNFSVTPSNTTFFSLSSDKQTITVNKACTVDISVSSTNGGGTGRLRLVDNGGNSFWELGVGKYDEITTSTGSTRQSFSAGSIIRTQIGSYTAGGGISFGYDNITMTLNVV